MGGQVTKLGIIVQNNPETFILAFSKPISAALTVTQRSVTELRRTERWAETSEVWNDIIGPESKLGLFSSEKILVGG